MKLYHNPLSPNVRRVRLTAAVLGIQLEEKQLDFAKGEHKNPEYLALNPNGAVPTLVDGDFVLTESRAIMQYLAAKKPESGLLPRDEAARADVTRWQFWDASHFAPQMGTLGFEKMFKSMMGLGEPDAGKIQDALGNFRRFAAVLNKRLDGKKYIVGDSLTIADSDSRVLADVREASGGSSRGVSERPRVVLANHGARRLEEDEHLTPTTTGNPCSLCRTLGRPGSRSRAVSWDVRRHLGRLPKSTRAGPPPAPTHVPVRRVDRVRYLRAAARAGRGRRAAGHPATAAASA